MEVPKGQSMSRRTGLLGVAGVGTVTGWALLITSGRSGIGLAELQCE